MSPPPHPEEEPFPTNYKKQSLLGTGSFATVHAATHTYTKKQVAVKAVPRVKLNRKLAESLEGEIRILKGIVHDKIVGLWEIEVEILLWHREGRMEELDRDTVEKKLILKL